MYPLPLITVASMFPENYNINFVDLSIQELIEEEILDSDLVLITGMITEENFVLEFIQKCKALGKPVIVGGPYVTATDKVIDYATVVKGEAEEVIKRVIQDFENCSLQKSYTGCAANMTKSPCPRYDLLDMDSYYYGLIQWSRGCPYSCEFCDISLVYGKEQRQKSISQLLNEFDVLYELGFRGGLEFADSNLITNKGVIPLMEAIINWQKEHNYPFEFRGQASINLAKMSKLLGKMTEAGFKQLFVGIETPVKKNLKQLNKFHNANIDIGWAIHKLHKAGIRLDCGTILGIDNEPNDISDIIIELYDSLNVTIPAISLLTATNNTKLYNRLIKEERLIATNASRNAVALNFKPSRPRNTVIEDFKKIAEKFYNPKNYLSRCENYLVTYRGGHTVSIKLALSYFAEYIRLYPDDEYTQFFIDYICRISERDISLLGKAVDLGLIGFHLFKIKNWYIELLNQEEQSIHKENIVK